MDAERWGRARRLFDELADQPESTWEGRLSEACADDADVRAEVLAMLRADAAATAPTGLLGHAPHVAASLAEHIAIQDALESAQGQPGSLIGPFRLLRQIGRGGMGAVWLAERADGAFVQHVAVKLIRSGWDADDVIARFRAERQILAGLQHPNIAHLIDGGVTPDGKPWLALEYIDGEDLRAWCDRARLGIEARLRLFLTVCDAVGHAHQRLIVHRDLKPSNILVGRDGVVKLLDFGIAKFLDASATNSATRVFTPEYAAPEQVRGEAVTTSVDIHALGLLLYELLCGRRPYQLENSTPAAYERAVLDQEPTRPSLVVAREDGTEAGEAIAANRDLDRSRLRRELRGDLDAIVMKALRKEPAQRYASCADLAADVRRHLERRPVLARRGNWRYRSERFLRRHAFAASFAILALAALVGGLGAAVWQARIARSERDSAREALAFMRTLFDNADPAKQKGDRISARDLLDAGTRNMRNAMRGHDSARIELMLTMASAYLGLGQLEPAAPLIDEAERSASARGDAVQQATAQTQRCRMLDLGNRSEECPALLDRAERLLDASDPAQAGLIAYGLALRTYGLQLRDRYDEIVSDMRRGLALLDESPEHRYLRVELSSHLAFAFNRLGRPAEAEAVLVPVVASLRGDDDAERVLLLDALGTLSSALGDQGRHDEAIAMQREAVDVAEKLYGKDNPVITDSLNTLARTLNSAGRLPEAIEVMERTVMLDRLNAVNGKNPQLASSLCNLAVLEIKRERDDEAMERLDEAIAVAAQAGFDVDLARSLYWRATLNLVAGRPARAHDDQSRMAALLAPMHEPSEGVILRGRALALAITFVEGGPAAATTSACTEAATISEAFGSKPADPDARFAGFLHELCGQPASPDMVTATLQRLDARHAAPTAHHLRVARAIDASWSRHVPDRR
ncbi:protein kinase domain-containing protein [Dokdonella sp.]|uniref:protein kinase domain-containing protein n=1 Tax=Dokdonella sp. TaxID=2291710 RepID=UPI00378448A5